MHSDQMSQLDSLVRVARVSGDAERAPRTYVAWSAAATILCLFPVGAVALGYGVATQRALGRHDLERARHHSRVARRWLIAAIATGLIVNVMLAGTLVVLGALSR